MKKLTQKEEEILRYFWIHGSMFVKELKEQYSGNLHYNTLSTIVRSLEDKGYIRHEKFGNTYRYSAAITEGEYSKQTLGTVIKKHFNSSYKNVVSMFVEDKDISLDDLKKLINDIESKKK